MLELSLGIVCSGQVNGGAGDRPVAAVTISKIESFEPKAVAESFSWWPSSNIYRHCQMYLLYSNALLVERFPFRMACSTVRIANGDAL
jgi:hypothetical protein